MLFEASGLYLPELTHSEAPTTDDRLTKSLSEANIWWNERKRTTRSSSQQRTCRLSTTRLCVCFCSKCEQIQRNASQSSLSRPHIFDDTHSCHHPPGQLASYTSVLFLRWNSPVSKIYNTSEELQDTLHYQPIKSKLSPDFIQSEPNQIKDLDFNCAPLQHTTWCRTTLRHTTWCRTTDLESNCAPSNSQFELTWLR